MSQRQAVGIEVQETYQSRNDAPIAAVKAWNDRWYEESGKRRRAHIATYGCQMNEHDSEKLDAMLLDMGYEVADGFDDADLILFNTCCVRENAELKVYGNLGRVKKCKELNPELLVAVCGCMMQQEHIVEEIRRKYRFVDLVFGTHNLHNFPTLLERVIDTRERVFEVLKDGSEVVEGLPAVRRKEVKAYTNIMYGCNNFCTYCIVPYTRGRERSRRPEDIVEEIRGLVESGTKEIMLLGQNVNSYGKDLTDTSFADLLRRIDKIPGIGRVRFMTSHPKDISRDLIDAMAECPSICDHLHLPLQSGSDRVLKAMNRHYQVSDYLETVRYARSKMPEIGITADIIVGFPGETEDDFEATLDVIREVEYDSAYTYIYSKRTGTPAATFANQVEESEKSARMTRLLAVLNPIVTRKLATYLDRTVDVLVEGRAKSNPNNWMGRTSNNLTVTFAPPAGTEGQDLMGHFVSVHITRPKNFSLEGEAILR
ncbi:MAG: tRNA (N6-isopentenyl adenosine(37)-C2)-methylthiotransferase MiaB [Bacillota bacterium]|nr:tRNA (N6-isopentenyl adenosine(37)-C2)-methylthiotransferase MiaB [Bacillota bacterium]